MVIYRETCTGVCVSNFSTNLGIIIFSSGIIHKYLNNDILLFSLLGATSVLIDSVTCPIYNDGTNDALTYTEIICVSPPRLSDYTGELQVRIHRKPPAYINVVNDAYYMNAGIPNVMNSNYKINITAVF